MGANFSSEPVVEKHTERDQNDTFTAAVSSCQGWRLSQEDEHSLMLQLPGEHKASFFAVFDGHGSGRVSKHASVGLWRHITENDKFIKGNFKEALEESFLSFDREVNESYNAQFAGTTAICILIVDNVIYCANIGDSRAVASINCECVPLSQDHKPENSIELKRILEAGGYVFGNRVNGNLALSRAFGDFHYKSNDQLPAEQQIVSPFPDVKRIELADDVDFIVLACDGIWDVLSSKEVVKFIISRLEQNVEPGLICEQLTTRCIATDYELVIGCDNMTVLLVCHTRGRSWEDYCTDIFNKHTAKLGVPRTRTFDENFDNTYQHEDHFMASNSSSSDYSRDTSLNRTFAANETSTDSDTSTSAGADGGGGFASSARGAHSLIDMIKQARDLHFSSTSDDETPPITEIVADEDNPQSSKPIVVDMEDQDKKDANDDTRSEEAAEHQTGPTTTTESDQDKQDDTATAADLEPSSGTVELHLSALDDNEGTRGGGLEQDESHGEHPPPDTQDTQAQDSVEKTIELELSSPDEEANEPDEKETQEGPVASKDDEDELPEVVNDLVSDEPAASEDVGEAAADSSQAEGEEAEAEAEADSNIDSNDNQEES